LNTSDQVVVARFASFTSSDFKQYLNDTGALFVMCHDGAMPENTTKLSMKSLTIGDEDRALAEDEERRRKVKFRAMISWFICRQYNIALTNELQFLDSRVMFIMTVGVHSL
jgi:ATP-dependent RNA helicase DDX60